MILDKMTHVVCVCALWLSFLATCARYQEFGDAELVYQWKYLDFDWPSEEDKIESIKNRSFVPERNLITGIKIYKDDVFVTIPRWKWTSGHPVTLAKVVILDGESVLQPYPNWAAQKQGDCNALQYVQSMEIDPNTGYMNVIDTGRIANVSNLCPAKIVVYDLNSDSEIDRFEFPDEVVSRTLNFLNDIVLDYINGQVRYAYISNPWEESIVAYNFQERSSYFLHDSTMAFEGNNRSVIRIDGENHTFLIGIDGIAMSPDFQYVYYCPLGGYNLYQIPTSTLRSNCSTEDTGIRLVGKKVSKTDGMVYGRKYLFYGALELNAVFYWDVKKDMRNQNVGMDKVKLVTQVEIVKDNVAMQWLDTFGFDEKGWLWVVACRVQDFFASTTGIDPYLMPYMNIWKIYVNDTSHLYKANKRTKLIG